MWLLYGEYTIEAWGKDSAEVQKPDRNLLHLFK